jgi:spermidine synthase
LPPLHDGGTVEVHSPYSHILVQRNGSLITLSFVRDTGEVVTESRMDALIPHHLPVSYTQYMFASYLFKPEPKRALLIGLGGGTMTHFLRRYDPALQVDAVEIDPEIVRIAAHYFGVTPRENLRIFTADGLQYLNETKETYDVIYMDAFLKPSASTDATGVPQTLKTRQFLTDIQTKLAPDGMVVFNLNYHDGLSEDVANIRAAFATVVFFKTSTQNLVAVALKSPQTWTLEQLQAAGQRIDAKWKPTFSFAKMSQSLVQPR